MKLLMLAIVTIAVLIYSIKRFIVPRVTTDSDIKSGILFAFYTKGNMLLPADRGRVGKL